MLFSSIVCPVVSHPGPGVSCFTHSHNYLDYGPSRVLPSLSHCWASSCFRSHYSFYGLFCSSPRSKLPFTGGTIFIIVRLSSRICKMPSVSQTWLYVRRHSTRRSARLNLFITGSLIHCCNPHSLYHLMIPELSLSALVAP